METDKQRVAVSQDLQWKIGKGRRQSLVTQILKPGRATIVSRTSLEVGMARMTEEGSGGVVHVEEESIQDGEDRTVNCLTTEGLVGGAEGGATITPEGQGMQTGSLHVRLKADNCSFLLL